MGAGARPRLPPPLPSRGGPRKLHPRTRHASPPHGRRGNTSALRASLPSFPETVIPSGARCAIIAIATMPAGPPRNPAAAAARPVVRHRAAATRARAAQRAPTAVRREGRAWSATARHHREPAFILQRKRTLRGADRGGAGLGCGKRACRRGEVDSSGAGRHSRATRLGAAGPARNDIAADPRRWRVEAQWSQSAADPLPQFGRASFVSRERRHHRVVPSGARTG